MRAATRVFLFFLTPSRYFVPLRLNKQAFSFRPFLLFMPPRLKHSMATRPCMYPNAMCPLTILIRFPRQLKPEITNNKQTNTERKGMY
jgi:hypothetical protein